LSLIVLQHVLPLCDYKVWIDIERSAEVKRYLRNMVELNVMEEEFHARNMVELNTPLTLLCSMRWLVTCTKRSERRRGYGSGESTTCEGSVC
jgi:hypothetical protein